MDFINEQNIVRFKIGEQAGKIAELVEHKLPDTDFILDSSSVSQ